MCGIIGIIGQGTVTERLLDSLARLEYRGYDSAGLAVLHKGTLVRRRAPGKIKNLRAVVAAQPIDGHSGIAHTRWATHGGPSETNAHPHATDRVALVHNGIIENYALLKQRLQQAGCVFTSETDTEVVVHLLDQALQAGCTPLEAVRQTLPQLEGAFALAILFRDQPDTLFGARRGSPLVIGYGKEELYLGSDALAVAPLTHELTYLEDGDWCHLQVQHGTTIAHIYDTAGNRVERAVQTLDVSNAVVDKAGHPHFMLKEIYEQPQAIQNTLQAFLKNSGLVELPANAQAFKTATRLTIVACGTSYYAGLVAKWWFERLAQIPTDVDIASEFRYRQPPLDPNGLTLFISQSGETADTLAAVEHARRQGVAVYALVNVATSSLARTADETFLTQAGVEIGVASTKAFTTQLLVLLSLALGTGVQRGVIEQATHTGISAALHALPGVLSVALGQEGTIKALSHQLMTCHDLLFMGRGSLYPIALEGALKMKELSYIHAEGYPAGELKHGPIALIEPAVPVVVVASSQELYEKTLSNVQEVMARGGPVIFVTDAAGATQAPATRLGTVVLPTVHPAVFPLVASLPMQLLAYHTAVRKGNDVDQPRNLAKSVTVE